MSKQPDKKRPGRPCTLGRDAIYLTVKFRRDQFKALCRIAGPAPGRRPQLIRDMIDSGIAAHRKRAAR